MQSISLTQNPAIGIDLGTTFCCVAIYNGHQRESIVIPNDLAKNTTPSYVAYEEDDEVIVGEAAQNLAGENPENTIFDVKRLLGRAFDDPMIQKYRQIWPFQVVSVGDDDDGVGVIAQGKTILPQQISKELVHYIRASAEAFLRRPVNSAVVTVPAYFSHLQRQLTRKACVAGGLSSVHLITEPTAASLAYSLQQKRGGGNGSNSRTCLTFDLGGGTFDVAILRIVPGDSGPLLQIKAIGGDPNLGGRDFDQALLDHVITKFNDLHGINLAEGKDSPDSNVRFKIAKRLRRIRMQCEKQKCFLSQTTSVTVSLDAIHGDLDLVVPVTRDIFEGLIRHLLDRCMDILDGIMEESGIGQGDIDDVVLIGGSSRIPKVQELLTGYFGGKQLVKSVSADEAVACGAALHAYQLFNADRNSSTEEQAVFEEPEMLGYYGPVDLDNNNNDLDPSDDDADDADADTNATVKMPYEIKPTVFEEPPSKFKHVIYIGLTNIHCKFVVQKQPINQTGPPFEIKRVKDFPPYVSWSRGLNQPPVIGKEAEKSKARPDTFHVAQLLKEKCCQMNRLDSFVRLASEEIVGKFFEIVRKKMGKSTSKNIGSNKDEDDDEAVIIYSGSATFDEERCLILGAILAGFRRAKIVPFRIAQMSSIILAPSPSPSQFSTQILILHLTWFVFESAVVTWDDNPRLTFSKRLKDKEETLIGHCSSRTQPNHQDFLHFHGHLMKRILTDRARVPNESSHTALAFYKNVIARSLEAGGTTFDRINAVYILLEENCGAMKGVFSRLLEGKVVTAIEEPQLAFEWYFLNYLFWGSKGQVPVRNPPFLMQQRLKEILPNRSSKHLQNNYSRTVLKGLLSFTRSGFFQVYVPLKEDAKKMRMMKMEEITDENGDVSQYLRRFQISRGQNGLFSLNR